MLRWMSGVAKLDRIRNERIRGTAKVGEISKQVQESRLKWYWHVLRREDEYVGKSRPAKSHGISVSLQKWGMISRSHGNITKSHGI